MAALGQIAENIFVWRQAFTGEFITGFEIFLCGFLYFAGAGGQKLSPPYVCLLSVKNVTSIFNFSLSTG